MLRFGFTQRMVLVHTENGNHVRIDILVDIAENADKSLDGWSNFSDSVKLHYNSLTN